ncbi:MAG: protein TolQ [Desulfobacterales bacterium]|nr:protein TolQ [Desulfobacterales bacterium]
MTPDSLNVFKMILDAGLMVQFVLLLLLLFSVTSWAIILIKFRYLRRAFAESTGFTEFFWKSRSLSDAFARSKQLRSSPVARIFRIGYLELKKLDQSGIPLSSRGTEAREEEPGGLGSRFTGLDNVQRALRRASRSEVTKMTQMVPFLATTGNTTPFIGLFGTVWGIMNSFHGIGLRGSASLAVVAPGISEALVATAAGLAVAIPAVIFFNYFMNRIRVLESELESFSADFINIIEREMLRREGGALGDGR